MGNGATSFALSKRSQPQPPSPQPPPQLNSLGIAVTSESYEYLKNLVPQLKREAQDWESKADCLETEVLTLRRELKAREQEVHRLQREVHKLKLYSAYYRAMVSELSGAKHPWTSWPRAVSRSIPRKFRPPHTEDWDDPVQAGYPGRQELSPPPFPVSLVGPIQGDYVPSTYPGLYPGLFTSVHRSDLAISTLPPHTLLNVQVSTVALKRLTARKARPRAKAREPRTPEAPNPKARTPPRFQRHHSSAIELTAPQSSTHFWDAGHHEQAHDVGFRPSPV
uniref:(California timema) hypothetical protein n=1 Tax=Timema californicum TaxID=61474 RepID=A0A7R9J862_TIMCA|nr:unnamed protein product [Timema californicum]